MDNTTTLYLLSTQQPMGITQENTSKLANQYSLNENYLSSLDIYNSTEANWPVVGSEEDEPVSAVTWTYLAIRFLWGALAIIGNSLTIFVVIKFERLQTCSNYLICSLAVSDLLSGLMVPLIMIHELYHNSWVFIPVCLIQQTVALISLAGNMLNIMYLSIDRYIYIAFPLRYQSLVTPQRIVIILTVTWINYLIALPTVIFTGNHLQASMPCRAQILLREGVMIFYFYPQIITIMILTIGFHLAIARIAHRQARQIQAQLQPYHTLDVAINKMTKKISRTLGLVLGAYLLCYIPQLIVSSITFNNLPLESIEKYTVALYWTNSWVNPLIYAWRLKDFRIAFKKIITGTGSFIEVPGINA